MTQRISCLEAAIVSLMLGMFASQTVADNKTVEPFNGKNLDGWKTQGPESQSKWKVGIAMVDPNDPTRLVIAPAGTGEGNPLEMVNAIPRGDHGVDIFSKAKFGSATISLEIMVPKGSNSGVYLMGEYEIQVLDSFGRKKLGMGDMGAIYGFKVPDLNASKEPGQWQTLSIEYLAPKFEGGKKVANLKVLKIVLNGKVILKDVEVTRPTGGGLTGQEHAEGPLMFQGNHGPVAFRNIKIMPKP